MLRDRLVQELGIDTFFTDRNMTGIRFCWGRYLAITKAIEQGHITSKAGTWPSDLPTFSEVLIVEIFISKSAWYNQKNHFAAIKKNFPNMVEWLNQDVTLEDEDQDVWGESREKYTLEDLREFLDLGGRLRRTQSSRPQSPNDEHLPYKGKGKSHKKKYN